MEEGSCIIGMHSTVFVAEVGVFESSIGDSVVYLAPPTLQLFYVMGNGGWQVPIPNEC